MDERVTEPSRGRLKMGATEAQPTTQLTLLVVFINWKHLADN